MAPPWELDDSGDGDVTNPNTEDLSALMNAGPPAMATDPNQDNQKALEKWRGDVQSARDKFNQTKIAKVGDGFKMLGLSSVLDPASATGHPEVDKTVAALKPFVDSGVIPEKAPPIAGTVPSLMPKQPLKPAQVVQDSSPPLGDVSSIVTDPIQAGHVEADLSGVKDANSRAALLKVYSNVLQTSNGDSMEAGRTMLLAKDVLNNNVTAGQWTSMMADAFGEPDSNVTNRYEPIFKEFQALGGLAPSPVEGESDPLRVSILNAMVAHAGPNGGPVSPADQSYLFGLYSDALQGKVSWAPTDGSQPSKPGTPQGAFDAFKQGLSELYGNAQAVGPLALTPEEAVKQYGPSLLLGMALGGPVGAVASVGIQAATPTMNDQMTQLGVPKLVQDAIDFGLYGAASRGGIAERLAGIAKLGTATLAGGAAATVAGVNPTIGEFAGPLLHPAMAGLVQRSLFGILADRSSGILSEEEASAAVKRMTITMAPSDIGKTVAFHDQTGVIDSFAGRDLLHVTLENGQYVLAKPSDLIAFGDTPGNQATWKGEAAGAGNAGDRPILTTPSGFSSMPVGEVHMHYTTPDAARSIMQNGYTPSPASADRLPGVYTVSAQNAGSSKFAQILGGDNAQGVLTRVPMGPVATRAQVDDVIRQAGLDISKPSDMDKAAQLLQAKGYVGADSAIGSVWFNPSDLKASLATSLPLGSSDFVNVVTRMMNGDINLRLLPNISGGAGPIEGLTAQQQTLMDFAVNNAVDRRKFVENLAGGAHPNTPPPTWMGQRFDQLKSFIANNPGLLNRTQPSFEAAAALTDQTRMKIAIQNVALSAAIKQLFGDKIMQVMNDGGRELMPFFKGTMTGDPLIDRVMGTIGDAAEHPEDYDLTPSQLQVIKAADAMTTGQATYLRDTVGIKQSIIKGAYVSHQIQDPIPTSLMQRLTHPMSPVDAPELATNRRFGGQSADFRKAREFPDLRSWSKWLGDNGKAPELNYLKLVDQRLQSGAALEARQSFLQSVSRAWGQPIGNSEAEKALRDSLSGAKSTLQDRILRSVIQDTRGTTQRIDLGRMSGAIRDVENSMESLHTALETESPIIGQHFANLEGRLDGLDQAANTFAGTAQNLDESAWTTDSRMAQTKTTITDLKNKIADMQAQVNVHRQAAAPDGWQEIGIGELPQKTAVPVAVAHEVNALMSPQIIGNGAQSVINVQQQLRNVLLSYHATGFTKMGYDLMTLAPYDALKNMKNLMDVMHSKEAFAEWAAQNFDVIRHMSNSGATFSTDATGGVESLHKAGGGFHLPGVAQINEMQFNRYLPMLKAQMWMNQVQLLTNLQDNKAGFGLLEHLPGWTSSSTEQVAARSTGADFNRITSRPGITQKVLSPLTDFAAKFSGLQNASQADIERAASITINNVGGGFNWNTVMTHPGLLQNSVFLTPSWLRANAGRIVMAAQVGNPAGVLARRFFFQNIMSTAVLSTVMSMAVSDRKPNLDPTSADFLDIQIGPSDKAGQGGSVPILPDKTYVRTIFRALLGHGDALASIPVVGGQDTGGPYDTNTFFNTGNPQLDNRISTILGFGVGHLAQLPHYGVDLATGKDATGQPVGNPLLHLINSFSPIAIQGLTDYAKGGPGQTPLTAATHGLFDFVPRNPYDVRDTYVAEQNIHDTIKTPDFPDGQPLTSYNMLSETQKAAFDKANPQFTQSVKDYQDSRQSPFAALQGIDDQHAAAMTALGKAFMGTALTPQDISSLGPWADQINTVKGNPTLWRQMKANLADYFKTQSDNAGGGGTTIAPTTLTGKIVQGYYTQVIDASKTGGPQGPIDYAAMDDNERAYEAQVKQTYGQQGLDALNAQLQYRKSDDPVAQAYTKDQPLWNTYFNYMTATWNQNYLQTQGGFTPAEAKQAASFSTAAKYQTWLQNGYVEAIKTSYPNGLPANILNYATGAGTGQTIAEKWNLAAGQRLNADQALGVAEDLATIKMAAYHTALGTVSDTYLIRNPNTLCAASYWGIVIPNDNVKPYLAACSVGRVPNGGAPTGP